MNLKGRYDMLRAAAMLMVGLPTGSLEELKQMATVLRAPALADANAAAALILTQALIVTHGKQSDEPAPVVTETALHTFNAFLAMLGTPPLKAGQSYTLSLTFTPMGDVYMVDNAAVEPLKGATP